MYETFFFLCGISTIDLHEKLGHADFHFKYLTVILNKYFQDYCFLYILLKHKDITATVPGTLRDDGKV